VLLEENQPPDLYVIPATAWRFPNALLVSRDYEGLKSKPEWGVQLSGRNRPLLAPYGFDAAVLSLCQTPPNQSADLSDRPVQDAAHDPSDDGTAPLSGLSRVP